MEAEIRITNSRSHEQECSDAPCFVRRTSMRSSTSSPSTRRLIFFALLCQPVTSDVILRPQPHPRDTTVPLRVTNNCPETIWPAVLTQNGVGPRSSGFELEPGASNPQEVSGDWQGRVWGRTNCSFSSAREPASGQGGIVCQTGDCGQFLECRGTVSDPNTVLLLKVPP